MKIEISTENTKKYSYKRINKEVLMRLGNFPETSSIRSTILFKTQPPCPQHVSAVTLQYDHLRTLQWRLQKVDAPTTPNTLATLKRHLKKVTATMWPFG